MPCAREARHRICLENVCGDAATRLQETRKLEGHHRGVRSAVRSRECIRASSNSGFPDEEEESQAEPLGQGLSVTTLDAGADNPCHGGRPGQGRMLGIPLASTH